VFFKYTDTFIQFLKNSVYEILKRIFHISRAKKGKSSNSGSVQEDMCDAVNGGAAQYIDAAPVPGMGKSCGSSHGSDQFPMAYIVQYYKM
jgi:hypothetical protein